MATRALVLGGGGRDVSGPMDGLLDLGVRGGIPSAGDAVDGLRSLSGRGPGADGVRSGASAASLCLGKVPARLMPPNGSGSKSSSRCSRGPKPPYPSFLGSLGGAMPPLPLLRIDADVPGRSFRPLEEKSSSDEFTSAPALEGKAFLDPPLLFVSKGPGASEFIRDMRSRGCFLGLVAGYMESMP